ncbi:MAG: phage tail protein [Anaerolineae bacterium]
MTADRQARLYHLLPALYRNLDEREDQPLRALMAVLESEFRRLEWDTEAMYDDWFIETCDRWVVPYIADLLGVRHLGDIEQIPHQRRLVANSIAYRRRKGTVAVVEQVARDATGWYARCVEFAHLVAKTQHLAYPQPDRGRTVDVRQLEGTTGIGGPFDILARTQDVDEGDQGGYNAEHVGLYLYRLRSYPIRRSFAHRVEKDLPCGEEDPPCDKKDPLRFTFDPLGRDIPVFNQPEPIVHISQRTQPVNLPLPLTRADLAADLQAHRARYGHLPKPFQPDQSLHYGPDRGLYIELPGGTPKIKPTAVVSMDLSQWPPAPHEPANAVVAVDVQLGRFAFVDQKQLPEECTINIREFEEREHPYAIVNYSYGLSSEVGGGPYHREVPLPQPGEWLFQIHVAQGAMDSPMGTDQGTGRAVVPGCVPTLQKALAAWEAQKPSCGVIRILDNGVYDEDLNISLPKGAKLCIVADNGVRPVIGKNGLLNIVCKDEGNEERQQLYLSGLLVHGSLCIGTPEYASAAGGLTVTIDHCTLVTTEDRSLKPAAIRVGLAEEQARGLDLTIEHSIVGPLALPETMANLRVSNSIVDNASGYAIAADSTGAQPGPALELERVTLFGQVHARKVVASEVIFGGPLKAPAPETKDQIQHSYVPPRSTTLAGEPHPSISGDGAPPRFTSTRYGDPGYAQLSLDCPREIRGGAADGSEMGAFHDLYQLQAEENLQEVLKEYLPLGLQASIQYVT